MVFDNDYIRHLYGRLDFSLAITDIYEHFGHFGGIKFGVISYK